MIVNLDSPTQCRRAYLNYLELGEASGISDSDARAIQVRYADVIGEWMTMPPDDENEYSFDDEEFLRCRARGESAGEDISGYDGNIAVNSAQAGFNNGVAVANTVWTGCTGGFKALKDTGGNLIQAAGKAVGLGGKKAATEGGKKIVENIPVVGSHQNINIDKINDPGLKDLAQKVNTGQTAAEESAKKAAEESAEKAAEKAPVGAYIQAGIAIAQAAYYWIAKPNSEEKEACDNLLNQMANNEVALNEQNGNLEDLQLRMDAEAQKVADVNVNTNNEIYTIEGDNVTYLATIQRLDAKKAAGVELTDAEKNTYNLYKGYINTGDSKIQTLSDDATFITQDSLVTLDGQQSEFDDIATTLGEVQGVTDYAASIDKAAQTSCYVEMASQGANAISGGMAAAKLFASSGGLNWVNIAMGAAALVASGSSVVAMGQQYQWAGQIGNEITARGGVENYTEETTTNYENKIQNYDVTRTIIDEYDTDT